jgi:hypothetical protein
MVFVTIQGEYRIEASAVETQTFPVGSVLLIEDTTGVARFYFVGAADALAFVSEWGGEVWQYDTGAARPNEGEGCRAVRFAHRPVSAGAMDRGGPGGRPHDPGRGLP